MFHFSVTINNVIPEILRILKLNICNQRQSEFSCSWLTDHWKISMHTEQDQSVLCLAQWGRLCAINAERHRLQKAEQNEGRDRNKNEDKLGAHWAREAQFYQANLYTLELDYSAHNAAPLLFSVWGWIHCGRINSDQPKPYLQISSVGTPMLVAPASPAFLPHSWAALRSRQTAAPQGEEPSG